jgi:hypothetical protein
MTVGLFKDSLQLRGQLRSLQMVLYTVFILVLFLGSIIVPLQIAAGEFENERERRNPYNQGWEDTSIMQR